MIPQTWRRRGATLAGLWFLAACGGRPESLAQPDWPLRPDSLASNGWDREADLLSVKLDLALDLTEGRIEGSVTHHLRNLRKRTSELRLHGVGLQLESIVDGQGHSLSFRQEEPWIHVALGRELEVGETMTLEISYQARPERGLHFRPAVPAAWTLGQFENTRHWIPVWDYPNDRAQLEGRYRVRDGLEVLSNGTLLEVIDHGGGERTFHWRLEETTPVYAAALAVGHFEHYADRAGETELTYSVPVGTGESQARRAFGETPQMLEFFEQQLGQPFPFASYRQVAVADYPWQGMENTTLTLVDDFLLGEEAEVADLEGDPRFLVAHELANHWFGNFVTGWGWSHLWLQEGWGSYLELLYQEQVAGTDSFRLWLERYRHGYLAGGAETRHPLSLDWFSQSRDLQRANHVYTKGPWVLFMLNCELGNDAFWRGTRAFLQRHAFGLATTQDFARSFFDTSGHNVEAWIEQWVEAGGHPVFSVEHRVQTSQAEADEPPGESLASAQVLLLRVQQVQPLDRWVPLFDLPVSVDVHYADETAQRFRIQVQRPEQVFSLPLEGELVDWVFDSECSLLCELESDKPMDMWLRQLAREDAPAQWRALEGIEPRLGASKQAREAVTVVLHESPHVLLRQRAAALLQGDETELLRAACEDPAPAVRIQALRGLLEERLDRGVVELLRSRRELETSPRAQALLAELLGESTEGR